MHEFLGRRECDEKNVFVARGAFDRVLKRS